MPSDSSNADIIATVMLRGIDALDERDRETVCGMHGKRFSVRDVLDAVELLRELRRGAA